MISVRTQTEMIFGSLFHPGTSGRAREEAPPVVILGQEAAGFMFCCVSVVIIWSLIILISCICHCHQRKFHLITTFIVWISGFNAVLDLIIFFIILILLIKLDSSAFVISIVWRNFRMKSFN